VAEGEITAGAFVADMNTIVSEDLEKDSEMYGKLVGHLKSPDFFDVASFPEGSFEISSVAKLEAPVVKDSLNLTHKITGNLTLKGITKSISFDAQVSVTDSLVSAKSQKIVIDRTEWGIKFKSKKFFAELKDKIINDEIVLSINLEATK
jgi:polyisoprenoid-binding protein YceI